MEHQDKCKVLNKEIRKTRSTTLLVMRCLFDTCNVSSEQNINSQTELDGSNKDKQDKPKYTHKKIE